MLPHADWSVQSADDPSMSIAKPILNSSQKGTNVWKQPSLFPSCWVIPKTSSAWCWQCQYLAQPLTASEIKVPSRCQRFIFRPAFLQQVTEPYGARLRGFHRCHDATLRVLEYRNTPRAQLRKSLPCRKQIPQKQRWCQTMTNHVT